MASGKNSGWAHILSPTASQIGKNDLIDALAAC